MATVFTLGHSNRTLEALLAMLRRHRVEVLYDIRKLPRSRAHPQFDGEALSRSLACASIAYEHVEALGGRRGKQQGIPEARNGAWEHPSFHHYADWAEGPEFRAALDRILARAARGPVALMCAEAVPWRCHRRIVTDWILARGVAVIDLFDEAHHRPAVLTPFARIEGDRVTYPLRRGSRPRGIQSQ